MHATFFAPGADPSTLMTAATTLQKICDNILQNPCAERFRRVRFRHPTPPQLQTICGVVNPSLVGASDALDVVVRLLCSIGFQISGDFLLLPSDASLHGLDKTFVWCCNVMGTARAAIEQRADRQVTAQLDNQRAQQHRQVSSQLSAMELYRKYAEERKAAQSSVAALVEDVDALVAEDTANASSSSSAASSSGAWTRAHTVALETFETLNEWIRNRAFIANAHNVPPELVLDVQDCGGAQFAARVEKMMKDSATASIFGNAGIDAVAVCERGTATLVVRSTKQQQNQQADLSEERRRLVVFLDSVIDALTQQRHNKHAKFDAMRSDVKATMVTHHRARHEQEQREKAASEPRVDPELEHSAVQIINDVSGYIELVSKLEGAAGIVAQHRIAASKLHEQFRAGKLTIVDLQKIKDEWIARYEKTKKEKGVTFSAARTK